MWLYGVVFYDGSEVCRVLSICEWFVVIIKVCTLAVHYCESHYAEASETSLDYVFLHYLGVVKRLMSRKMKLIIKKLNPTPAIAIAAYFMPFRPFLYLSSSPAAVSIINPCQIK